MARKPGSGLMALLIVGLLIAVFWRDENPPLNPQTAAVNIAGANQQINTEVPTSLQWELIEFVQGGFMLGTEPRDLGTFQNVQTGEIIQAYCLDPQAGDPIRGDVFAFNNLGNLEKIGGGGVQNFAVIFQPIAATATMVPTHFAVPTIVGTTVGQNPQGALVAPGQRPQNNSGFEDPLPLWAWICILGGALVAGIVGAIYQLSRQRRPE